MSPLAAAAAADCPRQAHHLCAVLFYGNAAYRGTGRGLALGREPFAAQAAAFYYSHFAPGAELAAVLGLYT